MVQSIPGHFLYFVSFYSEFTNRFYLVRSSLRKQVYGRVNLFKDPVAPVLSHYVSGTLIS